MNAYDVLVDRTARGLFVVQIPGTTDAGEPAVFSHVHQLVDAAARRYALHPDPMVRAQYAVGAATVAHKRASLSGVRV